MKKEKITISNIFYFIQGNIRYRLYYNKILSKLIRKHIREQIDYRIAVMSKECYDTGSCTMCGCKTTALQMSNKSCNKPCYPPMMKKKEWELFKLYVPVLINNDIWSIKEKTFNSKNKTKRMYVLRKNNKSVSVKFLNFRLF